MKLFKRKSKPAHLISDKVYCLQCKDVSYAIRFKLEETESGVKVAIGQCIKCGVPTKRIIS